MLEINFIIISLDLRFLCTAKTLYQSIAFVLQQLNLIFDNEYIRTFLFILVELKIYLIIENGFERKEFDRRMSDIIIYILC